MAGEEKESDRRRVTSIRAYIKALSKRSEQRVIFDHINLVALSNAPFFLLRFLNPLLRFVEYFCFSVYLLC
jgi:hypothetical protein